MTARSITTGTMVGATIAAIAALALMVGQAQANVGPQPSRSEVKRMIVQEAEVTQVPPALALALAKVESDFQANALSSAGARGVMQIMPQTAIDEYGVDPDELWDARLNIQIGIHYLESLRQRYGGRWELALSHYNGGTLKGSGGDAVAHSYTRRYVKSVLNWQRRYVEQSRVWQVAELEKDGWQPARTRVKRSGKKATVNWAEDADNYARPAIDEPMAKAKKWREPRPSAKAKFRWYPADRSTRRSVVRRSDERRHDFDDDIEQRRRNNRHRLDDFTAPAPKS
ncbi:MAG TPA: lytic transglycosylase domain-containing protein [Alphaproteobacteria bacterium]|jgi:hypothetical protein|nr:lytic transglycosylase domain-containing protein [Alphaproteobacteria bacterium]